jgi:peptidoglycan/xylan/chitin deacetylase (PgdA/CDA1 family)
MPSYIPNLIGARSAVRSLLSAFKEYEIHATWAVVGFLFADSGARLRQYLPELRPQYLDPKLSPYLDLPPEDSRESPESVFFAPSLIRQIAGVPNQEIGTHTLSHYYCLEPGQDAQTFHADLMAARSVARQFGIDLKSLVFPKNQCRADFLNVCSEAGIIAYRGTPRSWLYRASPDVEKQKLLRRLARLLDNYFPISSVVNQPLPLAGIELPVDVPASRFLRAYSPRLRLLEPFRLARIKREMTFAAKNGRLYHLWWHPHDFGINTETNLRFLRCVLDHFRVLHMTYGMESANMRETAQKSLSSNYQEAFDRVAEL